MGDLKVRGLAIGTGTSITGREGIYSRKRGVEVALLIYFCDVVYQVERRHQPVEYPAACVAYNKL